MSSLFTAEQISMALFKTDPIHTCCQENDCIDEYDRVAKDVVDRMADGQSFEGALHDALSDWFYDGEPIGLNTFKPAITQLLNLKD